MRRAFSTLVAIAAMFVALLTITAPSQAAFKDLNCDDFPNQAAAQANLNNNPSDPNGLDSEGDGKACESLPCPCAGQAPPQPNPVVNQGPKTEPVHRNGSA